MAKTEVPDHTKPLKGGVLSGTKLFAMLHLGNYGTKDVEDQFDIG